MRWLNSHDQKPILKHTVYFWKQRAFNEVDEPLSELIERTTRDLKMTEGLRVTKAGIMLSADIDCNEQRAAAGEQRIVRKVSVLM